MKDKFTITITDVNGSKHYLLHHIIKKFVIYFTIFVVFIIVTGSYLISFLMDDVTSLESKKSNIEKELITLQSKNDNLVQEIEARTKKLLDDMNKKTSILESTIDKKTYELDSIKDKISDIETMVGIKPSTEKEVNFRLEDITFASAQQKIFFDNIPNGRVIPDKGYSGKFGWRTHPILKRKEFHRGLDLRAKMMTPIIAPADGVIEYAAFHKSSGFGNLVIIEHNYGFKTTYAHLSKKFPFKAGAFVKKGEIIAYTGNSGMSTGPHLHYEVRFVTRSLDPLNFIKWNSSNFDKIFKKEKRVSWQSLIRIMKDKLHLQKQQS